MLVTARSALSLTIAAELPVFMAGTPSDVRSRRNEHARARRMLRAHARTPASWRCAVCSRVSVSPGKAGIKVHHICHAVQSDDACAFGIGHPASSPKALLEKIVVIMREAERDPSRKEEIAELYLFEAASVLLSVVKRWSVLKAWGCAAANASASRRPRPLSPASSLSF